MSKAKRRWIQLDYSNPDALTAECIPYDATTSVKEAIQLLSTTGIQGPIGQTGIQGPGVGATGIQGTQGSTGLGDLQPGVTGLQGIQGITGLQGIQGVTGLLGPTGIRGATGVVVATNMPSAFISMGSVSADIASSSFVDIPNLSTTITLDSASEIFATMSFEAGSVGAGSYPTGAFRVVIQDSSGDALEKYFLPDDLSIGSALYLDGTFAVGTYTVKGQARRVSGQQKIRIFNGQLYAHSLIGAKGDIGPAGSTGINGLGVTGLQGIQGATGIVGPTGASGRGVTGFQGMTGVGAKGSTGIQGITGIRGVAGSTGVAALISPYSSFVYFDSTSQLYDNTSEFIDIPGLNTTFVVDTSGVYAYSSMTLLADSTSSPYGSGYVEASFRIVVDDQTGLEYQRYVQNDFDLNSNTIEFRTGQLSDGTHIAKGQLKITDTTGDNKYFNVRKGQLFVQVLEGSAGPTGDQGPRGYQGATGIQGLGITGLQGIPGVTGIQGIQGDTGIQGVTGCGVTGIGGPTGIQGLSGNTGVQGTAGPTGIQGTTTGFLFNPVSRYSVVDTVGSEVWVVSSSTVFHGLQWYRVGTNLTIYRNNHGHVAGNKVIIRNTNMDYQTATIDSTTISSFNITTTNSDGTIGYLGAYSLGFTYTHDGSTGGTVYAPSGDRPDCQLLSMRIRTGTRLGSTYDLVVPDSAVNGAGQNTGLGDCYIPDFNVRSDADSLSAVAATMITNVSGSYKTFEFGNLGSGSLSRMIILHF